MPAPQQRKSPVVIASFRRQLVSLGAGLLAVVLLVCLSGLWHGPEASRFAGEMLPDSGWVKAAAGGKTDVSFSEAVGRDARDVPQAQATMKALGASGLVGADVGSYLAADSRIDSVVVRSLRRRARELVDDADRSLSAGDLAGGVLAYPFGSDGGPTVWMESLPEHLPDTLLPVFRGDSYAVPTPLVVNPRVSVDEGADVVENRSKPLDGESFRGSPDRLPVVLNEPVAVSPGLLTELPDTTPAVASAYPVTVCPPVVDAHGGEASSSVSESPRESGWQSRRERVTGGSSRRSVLSSAIFQGVGRYPLDARFERGEVRPEQRSVSVSAGASPAWSAVPCGYPLNIPSQGRYPLGVDNR